MIGLKRQFFLLFLMLSLILSDFTLYGQSAKIQKDSRALRLFVIGNSFSRNATLYLPQLAKEAGRQLVIQKAEISGGRLKSHWDGVQASENDPADAKGKPYGGRSLKELLSEGTWDIVTLQQGSVMSADIETYHPYIKKLCEYIKKLQPTAEIVIHQTWAYRNDARFFSTVKDSVRAKDQQEMYEKSRAAYHQIAQQFNFRIIPTGDAFWTISSNPKWAYRKDSNFNFSKPVYPELPDQKNSLNVGYSWTPKKVFKLDANHANAAGCYLGALTWYGFLFNESPEKLKFTPDNIAADFSAELRKTAWQVVQANKGK